jgi:hypothetical protein
MTTETEFEGEQGQGSKDRTKDELQQAPASQTGRPPSSILTFTTNLMLLQKQFKGFVKGKFEFRSTRNGIRVVTNEVVDFLPYNPTLTPTNYPTSPSIQSHRSL